MSHHLISEVPSFLAYSTGHTDLPWYSVGGDQGQASGPSWRHPPEVTAVVHICLTGYVFVLKADWPICYYEKKPQVHLKQVEGHT